MPDDPYAEFGGQPITGASAQPVTPAMPRQDDPYAEFGGQPVNQPTPSNEPPTMLTNIVRTMNTMGGPTAFVGSVAGGAIRGAAKTYTGTADLVGSAFHGSKPTDIYKAAKHYASEENENLLESGGEFAENLAEYIYLEGALKAGLKGAEAFRAAQQMASLAEKYPVLGRAVHQAIVQGTAGGIQTAAKTGSAEEGVISGVVQGGVGGVLGAGGGGTQKLVKFMQRPYIEGNKTVRESAQELVGKTLTGMNATREQAAAEAAEAAAARGGKPLTLETAAAGQEPVAASDYTGNAMPTHRVENVFNPATGLMEKRGVLDYPPGAFSEEAGTIPTERTQRTIASGPKGGDIQLGLGLGGELQTQDPEILTSTIKNINEHMTTPEFDALSKAEKNQLVETRNDAQRQLADLHASQPPTFQPVDVEEAIRNTRSMPDAVEQIRKNYDPVFKRLDELTGNEFSAVQQMQDNAWKEYVKAASPEARQQAGRNVAASKQAMDDLFTGLRGKVKAVDLRIANQAFKENLTVRNLSSVIEDAMEGFPEKDIRTINGAKLTENLKKMYDTENGRQAVADLVGEPILKNLENVAKFADTRSGAAEIHAAVRKFARHAIWATGLSGAAGYAFGAPAIGHIGLPAAGALLGSEIIQHQLMFNPKFGNFFLYVAEHKIPEKVAAPILSSIMAEALRPNAPQAQGRQRRTVVRREQP